MGQERNNQQHNRDEGPLDVFGHYTTYHTIATKLNYALSIALVTRCPSLWLSCLFTTGVVFITTLWRNTACSFPDLKNELPEESRRIPNV